METLYSIGEAADILGVSVPTLRLYEREGLIVPIRKKSKHRLFSATDLERVKCLRKCIHDDKVGISGMRHLLAMIPCWKIHDCMAPDREKCPAFNDDETPCWAVKERPFACSNADCRNCTVYNHITDCSTLKRTIAQFTIDKG
jgi:MerR family transcriptional regulator, heat shock protein HspR